MDCILTHKTKTQNKQAVKMKNTGTRTKNEPNSGVSTTHQNRNKNIRDKKCENRTYLLTNLLS